MTKRKTSSTQRKLKQGRGQGHGKDYLPFLTVRDVPSLGTVSRINGHKTSRVHHLMSGLERNYFYFLEWSSDVVDIREQYPLDSELTHEIADRLGIKHPTDPKTKEPIVMTTDFLIDVVVNREARCLARSIKPFSALGSLRTIEKQEIERTYWTEKKIDWGIVTEKEMPKEKYKAIEWVHDAYDFSLGPITDPESVPQIESDLLREIHLCPEMPLSQVALKMDKRLGLKSGTCLWLARHLVVTKQWMVSLQHVAADKPLPVEATKSQQERLA